MCVHVLCVTCACTLHGLFSEQLLGRGFLPRGFLLVETVTFECVLHLVKQSSRDAVLRGLQFFAIYVQFVLINLES